MSDDIQQENLKPMKAQMWNKFMNDKIPALKNMTPVEASKSKRGIRLLEQLFNFYDDMRSGGDFLDCNIPSAYARWKLGYGPGSAE